MREIKFRGRCVPDSKYAGEWVTGGYVTPDSDCKNQSEGLIVEYFGGNTTITYHVNPNTVGQFTGLCDKNGVNIFEGDIVHMVWQDPMFSKWHEKTMLVEFKWGRFTVFYLKPFEHSDKHYFEVIGNIYDNPELLNKE